MKATIYNKAGAKAGDIDLPEAVFGLDMNEDLVHQVYVSMMSNKRANISHTKDRGEVRGGGRKPWKQKGTGRARVGSNRSPIWIGGGITFGPRNEKNFTKKINKKMRTKALLVILSQKMRDGEIIFVDSLAFDAPKAKEAAATFANLAKVSGFEGLGNKTNNRAYIAVSESDTHVQKSFANFSNVSVDELRKINPVDLLKYKYLVITNPSEAIATLEAKVSKKVTA